LAAYTEVLDLKAIKSEDDAMFGEASIIVLLVIVGV